MEVARELASLGVEIGDNAIRYRNRDYLFSDIASVGYTATKTRHSVNLIPTGTSFDAQCRLALQNGEVVTISASARNLFGGDGKDVIAPIWLCAEIVSELTFDHRVTRFERCLQERKFAEFGNYQIHRDGTVYKKARKVGSIAGRADQVRLGPFHLTVAGTNGGHVEMPIDVDRDCLLYILQKHHKLVWKGERVRERRGEQKRRLYEGIVALGAKISKADGSVSIDEIRVFKDFFRTEEFPLDDVGSVFNAAVRDSRSVFDCARELADAINDDALLDQVLIGLIAVAAADSVLQSSERSALYEVGLAFGLSKEAVEHLIFVHAADVSGAKPRAKRSSDQRVEEAAKHLQVLGLSGVATPQEIKDAYRRLAASFHPDLLRSKGVPRELVDIAEETLVKLNISYEWLRKNNYGVA